MRTKAHQNYRSFAQSKYVKNPSLNLGVSYFKVTAQQVPQMSKNGEKHLVVI